MLVDEYHHDKISDFTRAYGYYTLYVTTYFDEIYCGFYLDTYLTDYGLLVVHLCQQSISMDDGHILIIPVMSTGEKTRQQE